VHFHVDNEARHQFSALLEKEAQADRFFDCLPLGHIYSTFTTWITAADPPESFYRANYKPMFFD
jgi:hypothetical protein